MRIDANTERTAEGKLVPTPGQTIGPFFGYAKGYEQVYLPFRDGHFLVHPASANAVRLTGRVLDGNGDPIPDAMLEIWQADEQGNIPQKTGSLVRDGFTFTGWGRGTTDNVGTYTFSTVNPGQTDQDKAPFISMVIFARGLLNKLHTRIYLPEYTDLLAADPLLSSLDEDRRQTLIAERDDAGALHFDVRLQGDAGNETVFLQFPGIDYPTN